jgi:hypothetical protein
MGIALQFFTGIGIGTIYVLVALGFDWKKKNTDQIFRLLELPIRQYRCQLD